MTLPSGAAPNQPIARKKGQKKSLSVSALEGLHTLLVLEYIFDPATVSDSCRHILQEV